MSAGPAGAGERGSRRVGRAWRGRGAGAAGKVDGELGSRPQDRGQRARRVSGWRGCVPVPMQPLSGCGSGIAGGVRGAAYGARGLTAPALCGARSGVWRRCGSPCVKEQLLDGRDVGRLRPGPADGAMVRTASSRGWRYGVQECVRRAASLWAGPWAVANVGHVLLVLLTGVRRRWCAWRLVVKVGSRSRLVVKVRR